MVRKHFKNILFFYLQMTTVWSIAWLLFYYFRHYGVEEFPYIEFSREPNRVFHFFVHLGAGVLTGILYSTSELLFDRRWFQKQAYGRLIFIKTVIYLFIALIVMSSAVFTFQYFQYSIMDWTKLRGWLSSRNFAVLLTYFMVVSVLISFIRQVNYKFGPGVIWKMLMGKYHQPSEEDRIFMFLDLRSSTTIAERLGHIRFSRFIQDCFFDLTDVVIANKVDIYQYVGDEAVLSWSMQRGLEELRCLRCYFDFMEVLNDKAEYYEKTYGIRPFFKAGLHFGKVTVAEVGVIKREIAYHGDVLNTAARIQSRCNELGEGLLISEALAGVLSIDDRYQVLQKGEQLLRGKDQSTKLFAVRLKE